ncbi:serine protease 30-like [Panulirus ornatus]|uniref:serine protease 30-like n=1 Tax=Panulirus ornatus TaxID=150431 RepID=UPI003A85DCFA
MASGSSLTLASPNYPAAYDYRTKCGWIIKPTSRNVVLTLRFDTFDLQPVNIAGKCPDFLKLNRTRYCGNNIPRIITATNVTRYKVIFKTNGGQNYKGFQCTVTANNPNTDNCSCGDRGQARRSPKDLSVAKAEFPWQAALVVTNTSEPFCGASIIYEHWLLTSAACAQRIKHNKCNYNVIVGTHNLSVAAPEHTRLPIRKVVIHPGYDIGETHSKHNVALIRLKTAIPFQRRDAAPVCLPHPNTDYTNQTAILTGWGTDTGSSRVVEKVAVRTVGRSACAQQYNGRGVVITTDWLCAAAPDNTSQQRLCQAGPGGPLVVKVDESQAKKGGRYVQVGVAAFNDGCSLPSGHPPAGDLHQCYQIPELDHQDCCCRQHLPVEELWSRLFPSTNIKASIQNRGKKSKKREENAFSRPEGEVYSRM